nr:FAD-dependent oxidoreductase [Armatimonadota bacterium]
MAKTQIVILGGGFGGVYTATYLEKLLKPDEADIHLVSRENYLVFSPMLPELISGSIELFHAITPIRELCHRTHLHTREVEQIDLEGKTITTSPGIRAIPHQLTYDHLVLGLGTQLSFRGMPGLEQHGIPFKNVGDAFRIRNHVIHALEEADIESDPEIKQELLTVVVAGGGFAGVEGVAELNDFLREAAKSYVSFKPSDIKVILLHAQDRILQEIKEKLGVYAQNLLQKRGVEIRFNTRLAGASACEAILTSGEKIPTRTIITTVPSAPNPLLAGLPGAKENRGKVPVNEHMQLLSHPGVWGLGD